jgi:hypothetical protein
MLHPALAQALATAHVEDQLRAAARWQTIRRARRVARESRVAHFNFNGRTAIHDPALAFPALALASAVTDLAAPQDEDQHSGERAAGACRLLHDRRRSTLYPRASTSAVY